MEALRTNTGIWICPKHRCDLEPEKGKLYCPECRKEQKARLQRGYKLISKALQ